MRLQKNFASVCFHYWKDALNNLCNAGLKMIARENAKRVDVRFEVGQKVLQEVAPQDVGPNLKQMKYDNGPYTITQVLGPTTYELIDNDKNVFVSNVSQLKRYYLRQEIPRLQMLEEIGKQDEVMDTRLQKHLKEAMSKLENKRTGSNQVLAPVTSVTRQKTRDNCWGSMFLSRVIYPSQVDNERNQLEQVSSSITQRPEEGRKRNPYPHGFSSIKSAADLEHQPQKIAREFNQGSLPFPNFACVSRKLKLKTELNDDYFISKGRIETIKIYERKFNQVPSLEINNKSTTSQSDDSRSKLIKSHFHDSSDSSIKNIFVNLFLILNHC